MTRFAVVLFFIILLFTLSSCDDDPSPSQSDPREEYDAHATVGALYNAIKMYRQDGMILLNIQ